MSDLPNDASDDLSHPLLAGIAEAQLNGARQRLQAYRTDAPQPAQEQPGRDERAEPNSSTGQRLVAAPLRFGADAVSGLMSFSEKTAGALGSVAKDVGLGALDAPRQLIGGGLDLVNNIWNFADVAVKQAETAGLPNVYFRLFDESGKWAPGVQSQEDFRSAQAAGEQHVFQVPTTGKSEQITGQIVRTAVPFLLGRGVTGSPLAGIGGSFGGEIARDFISGVVSQDPKQPRLSNIIESVAPNVITDFLSAKPEDEGTVLGHLKSGLEYAGLSALVGGSIRALKALKESGIGQQVLAGSKSGDDLLSGAGAARPAETPPPQAPAGVKPPAAPARDILSLGDPLEPAVTIRPTARDAAMAEITAGRMNITPREPGVPVGPSRAASGPRAAAPPPEPSIMSEETISAYLSGARADNPVKINLGRIGSNEDIADALAQVSKTIPKQAVQSNQATIALADALGLQPADFLKGYKGQNLDASQITAMRFMLDSSGEQLVKFAEAARDPLADAATKGQFLRAFTTHRALQAYAENARAEAGRSLQAWNILSQQREGYSRSIADLIRNSEGVNGDLTAMAEQVATVGNGLQANRFVANTMRSGSDVLMTAWYNALLSSPTTMVKNLASDFSMATWNVVTTGVAEKFGHSVVPGETEKLLQGYIGGFKDAVRAAGRAARAGESQFYGQYNSMDALKGSGPNAIARRFNNSLALNGYPEGLNPDAPTEAAGSVLKTLLPTSWLSGENDFVKLWNYRAELRRLSWRSAQGNPEQFRQLMDNPPTQLHQQALSAALRQGFQEPLGPVGEAMMAVRDGLTATIPHTNFEVPFGRLIVPFLRTPINLLKQAATNSPVGALMREPMQIIAGGASPERDILIAKMGLGSAVSLAVADLALNNYVTGKGPSDPANNRAWRAAGNRPYSLQIPGMRAVQINQVDPAGIIFGAIADTFNILKFSEDDDMDTGTLVASLVFGVGNAMLSKSYMQGLSDFFEGMNDPQREGSRWLERLGGTVVPSGVARLARATDEWERAHYGFLDSLEARLPWVREGLPPQRTLWGEPVPVDKAYLPLLSSQLANIVSPIRLGPAADEVQPIDKWIWDNRTAFPIGARGEPRLPTRMRRTQPFVEKGISVSVQLSPKQYDRLQVLAGNELKGSDGFGAKDTLNALVEGRHPSAGLQRQWDEATPELRAMEVSSIIHKYQAAAKEQLLQDDPKLRAMVEYGLRARAGALTGQPP